MQTVIVHITVVCDTCLQAFLVNDDLGESLDSVEALSKKHDDFERSLAAQDEKIKVVQFH